MNLIICNSTFQIFLATKIIDLYPKEQFCAIVFAQRNNEKNKYYYEILNKKCYGSLYLNAVYFQQFEYKWHIKYIFNLIKQLYKWKINKKSKFFISSIDLYTTHCLLSFIRPKEIYTFDDGTANIVKTGYFYDPFNKFGLRGRIFNKIFNINYDLNKIKKESKLHYTIFPNMENIIKNTQYINLFKNNLIQYDNNRTKNINLFIGQHLGNRNLVNKLIEEYNIHYYLPHPNENYKIDNVEYINTPLIFEDYFVQNLADKNVTIYTLFSTAALNVASLPNVKIISIKPRSIKNKSFLETYDIFKEMGIEIIDYDDSEI